VINLLKSISKINSAPGFENEIREFIKSRLMARDMFTDAYGNLIVRRGGEGTPVVIAAAMDVPSVFVTHKCDNGFVRFVSAGFDAKKLTGAKVKFKNACGIVFEERKKEENKEHAEMFIDLGDNEKVSVAEPGMIDENFCVMGDNVSFFSAGIRGALCAAIHTAGAKIKREAYFVFLAKTVIGTTSFSVLSFTKKAREIIVLDKSRANDFPGENNGGVLLSGGAALRIMDKTMISSREMVEKLSKYENEVKIQKEVSDERSLCAPLYKEGSGFRAVSLGIPTRYYDDVCETVNVSDIKASASIITKYLNE
jgi:putative aminopeptidase FrvX